MRSNLCPKQRQVLVSERCLTDHVIEEYKLGFTQARGDRRLSIPVANENGQYVDVRCWLHPEFRDASSAKVLPLMKWIREEKALSHQSAGV